MSSDILSQICARKRIEVADARELRPMAEVEAAATGAGTARDFRAALEAPGISLIAEIKRASPSRGEIAPGLDPASLARDYAEAGARALSVLTDLEGFGGSLDDLRAARAASPLPALRKDFILEPYQAFESRAAGADAALLIVAALTPTELSGMIELLADLGLAPVVEVHNSRELEIAIDAGANVIGVNNRNLRTFEVNLSVSLDLAESMPSWVVSVAESGISTRNDVERIEAAGYDAILVGESLLVSGNVGGAIDALLGT